MNETKHNLSIQESQYPFGKDKYEIKTGNSIKKYYQHRSDKFIILHIIARLFLKTEIYNYLSTSVTEVNAADMVRSKYADIIDNEICFVRQKTHRTSNV